MKRKYARALKVLALCLALAGLTACKKPLAPQTERHASPAANIRTSDPLDPEAERLALRLPPGFEAQLFAAEPEIGKPLNMSFDARGRMWVTQSYAYPFADTTGAGKDRISILEDTDGDGRADKVTTFADSLNIPIGIQVVPGGVIVYSIPHIWYLIDHDGDDRVDERRILYSGFGHHDTHGMVNHFVRAWDGWIHANHGFSNISKVAGSDGDTISMTSGNTFRFRMDGSRVEFTTTGRVNPYGYAYDELGYTYSTDCHTSPVYQLVWGADYPHFGKQPTGIGFGPALMKHTYGSTALAGLDYYIADQFPAAYRYNFYYGDVLLSRVSRSNFTMNGTTPVIRQEEDFITSDDPWFRPVDVKLGPDGALYVADFYNRIIGHYEVPLDHPGRDRQRGRIWRIVYTGKGAKKPEKLDYSAFDLPQLTAQLNHPNLPLRMAIADAIVDRFGDAAIPAMQALAAGGPPLHARIQALWILYRLDGLNPKLLETAGNQPNDTLKVHVLRILFEMNDLVPALLEMVKSHLNHADPHVRRQAVMVMGKNPAQAHVPLLLKLLKESDEADTHLYYSIRQSLRDQLRDKAVLDWANAQNWPEAAARFLADAVTGVDAAGAGQFLLRHVAQVAETPDKRKRYAQHAARWLPARDMDALIAALEPSGKDHPNEDYAVFLAMQTGMEQDGKVMGAKGREWATRLATHFLTQPLDAYGGWRTVPIDRSPYHANTWTVEDSTRGDPASRKVFLLSSGGNSISVMHSPVFLMPKSLRFTLRGHKEPPDGEQEATPPTNRVELILQASGEVLEFAEIDRETMNEKVAWSGNNHVGQEVYVKIVDGSTRGSESIAVGEWEPAVLAFPPVSPASAVERQRFAARITAEYRIQALIPALHALLEAKSADIRVRDAAAQALLTLNDAKVNERLAQLLTEPLPLRLKELWLVSLSASPRDESRQLIPPYMPEISYESQKAVVMNWANAPEGIPSLLDAAADARINPRLLRERQVAERLQVNMSQAQQSRYGELMKTVAAPANIDWLIRDRLNGYSAAEHDAGNGKALFSVHCGVCHTIGDQGGNIGPQLDGIGNWGPQALAEKILDPNRNISKAFTMYTIKLKDGTVKAGLLRREAGEVIVFADVQGQEFSIEKSNIVEQKPSPYTLMPDSFREAIPEADFKDLLAYLLRLSS